MVNFGWVKFGADGAFLRWGGGFGELARGGASGIAFPSEVYFLRKVCCYNVTVLQFPRKLFPSLKILLYLYINIEFTSDFRRLCFEL